MRKGSFTTWVLSRFKRRWGGNLNVTDPEKRREVLGRRKRIEAKFGQVKKHHQMVRTRYRGRWRVAIQVLMTFIVANLKRMIELLQRKENCIGLAVSSG